MNLTDIPELIKFRKNLIPIQEEYKQAMQTKIHPNEDLFNSAYLDGRSFQEKCIKIYECLFMNCIQKLN